MCVRVRGSACVDRQRYSLVCENAVDQVNLFYAVTVLDHVRGEDLAELGDLHVLKLLPATA